MARETALQAIWRTNRKIPVALAVLCLVNIAGYLLLTGVFEEKALDLERQYIRQQAEVRKAEQGGRSAESPLVVYARGTKDLKTFREMIPPKSKLTGLIGEIDTLATSSGLKIDRISFKPEHLDGLNLLQYRLDFNVAGTYSQIKRFTHKIEQSERLMMIDEMALNSKDDVKNVNLKLTLTTFFRAEAS